MGVINETLKLTDHFSAAFQTFIQMGSRSAGTAQASSGIHGPVRQDIPVRGPAAGCPGKGVLASQESLYAAQGQRLDAQRQKVAELAARHAKLAASKGMEARSDHKGGRGSGQGPDTGTADAPGSLKDL